MKQHKSTCKLSRSTLQTNLMREFRRCNPQGTFNNNSDYNCWNEHDTLRTVGTQLSRTSVSFNRGNAMRNMMEQSFFSNHLYRKSGCSICRETVTMHFNPLLIHGNNVNIVLQPKYENSFLVQRTSCRLSTCITALVTRHVCTVFGSRQSAANVNQMKSDTVSKQTDEPQTSI